MVGESIVEEDIAEGLSKSNKERYVNKERRSGIVLTSRRNGSPVFIVRLADDHGDIANVDGIGDRGGP